MGQVSCTNSAAQIHIGSNGNHLLFNDKVVRGCELLQNSPNTRKAFMKYLKREIWLPTLGKYQDNSITNTLFEDDPMIAPEIYQGYIMPHGTVKLMHLYIDNKSGNNSDTISDTNLHNRNNLSKDEQYSELFTTDELRSFLLSSVLLIFLESDEFKINLAQGPRSSLTAYGLSKLAMVSSQQNDKKYTEDLDKSFSYNKVDVKPATMFKGFTHLQILYRKLMIMHELELKSMISEKSWLDNMISAVENLSLSVTVADARRSNPGFPIIYVNRTFETTTGYSREEVLGKSLKILHSSRTETEQVMLMSAALSAGRKIKLALTNAKKDGTQFFNMLALNPVHDSKGRYTCVIGVQYNILESKASQLDLQLIDSLLDILSTILQ